MKALINKTDSDGVTTTFTIVGYDEDDIDNVVDELQNFAYRNSIFPTARFCVDKYLK
ncbi:MAG: hypothetical protein LBO74_08640 [Candidatus Symbiothrix sp.]|jgi:hypothetical protein|nr:hypothetical protein [Candidatus Symbiothrix sp.]